MTTKPVHYLLPHIGKHDPDLHRLLMNELDRQNHKLELIASENCTSLAIMEAQGTWLTNKYAEGLPTKRYYGGCEWVDEVEQLAISRAKEIFKAEHVNVQPHSGAQANMAVYLATLSLGDTVLGMNLSHGGHLTHGSHVNMSGLYFNFIPYGVHPDTLRIDYDQLEKLAQEHKPKMIVAGASSYPRIIDFNRIRHIADSVNAIMMVDMAHIAGLVAAGLHPNPVPIADIVTSTTHKTLRGPRGGIILCQSKYQKAIDKAVFPGMQGGPLMHVIAAKALCFKEIMNPDYIHYQQQVIANAQALGKALKKNDFKLCTDGTDNHLLLLDLRPHNLTGKAAEAILGSCNITVNKNTVPFETESPFVTSGIRLGTPTITSRHMKEAEAEAIGHLISQCLKNHTDPTQKDHALATIKKLTNDFPLYPSLYQANLATHT